MPETTCIHDRWIIEIEPDVWVHEDDDEQCTPAEFPAHPVPRRAGGVMTTSRRRRCSRSEDGRDANDASHQKDARHQKVEALTCQLHDAIRGPGQLRALAGHVAHGGQVPPVLDQQRDRPARPGAGPGHGPHPSCGFPPLDATRPGRPPG